MMSHWLFHRYGKNQASEAIGSIVEQLCSTPHYAIVKLGRGSKLEEVHARFSSIKPTGIGMQMFGVRIWVNHREWLDMNDYVHPEVTQ